MRSLPSHGELFRTILEASPCGILLVSRSGAIELANEAARRMFGREDLAGAVVDELIPQSVRPRHHELRDRYHADPSSRAMGAGRDLHAIRGSEEFPVEVALTPLRLDDRDFVLCSVVDISERKRSEEVLAEHARRLEQSNRDLDRFASVVSHDLRAPMKGVAAAIEFLVEDIEGVIDAESREQFDLILDRVRRLGGMLDGILSYSKASDVESERCEVDPNETVRDLARSLRPPDGISIGVRGTLPRVVYDRVQLTQVLQNLIGNAIQHIGNPRGSIVVSAREEPGRTWFTVADDGVGIPERHLDRIFGLFQTVRSETTRDDRPSGIGLAIVKRIVERNGGEVRVASREGEGTTFEFSIPAGDGSEGP